MQLELYNAVRKNIEDNLPEIKWVRLWNNQLRNYEKENEFQFPAIFIKFGNIQYSDYLKLVQKCEMTITIILAFESFKNEDTDVLRLKQDLNRILHGFQSGSWSKMARREERPSYDFDQVQAFEIDYKVTGPDFSNDTRPTIQSPNTQLNIEINIEQTNNI